MLKSICSQRLIKPRGLFSGVRTFYLLLVSRYFLLVAPYFLLVTRYFFTHYSLLFTRYLLLLSRYFLLVTCCSLLVTRYFLFGTCYYLLVTLYFTFHSSLLTRYSLLFVCYFGSSIFTIYLLNFGNVWTCLKLSTCLMLIIIIKKTRRTIVITAYIPFELKSGNVTARRGTNMLILTSHQL